MTYQGTGWFGIGISLDGTMGSNGQGTDMVLCTVQGNTGISAQQNRKRCCCCDCCFVQGWCSNCFCATFICRVLLVGVQRYWATSTAKPSNGVTVPDATCTTSNGVGTMTFIRSYQALQPQNQRSIERTGDVRMIYAYHTTSKALTYHDERGGLTIKDLANGVKAGGTLNAKEEVIPLPSIMIGHGLLMMLSWGLILPMGVAVAHLHRQTLPKGWWFKMHKALQYLGWFLQLVGFIMAFVYKENSHFQGKGIAELHMVLGGIVVLIGTLQPLNAFLRPHKTPGEPISNNRKCWECSHKGFGYLAVLGGMANCVLAGFVLQEKHTGSEWIDIVFIFCAISFLFIAIYAAAKSSANLQNNQHRPQQSHARDTSVLKPPPKHQMGIQMPQYESNLGTEPNNTTTTTTTTTTTNGLPKGWSHKTSSNGEPYYYHSETGESSWTLPTEPQQNTPPAVCVLFSF